MRFRVSPVERLVLASVRHYAIVLLVEMGRRKSRRCCVRNISKNQAAMKSVPLKSSRAKQGNENQECDLQDCAWEMSQGNCIYSQTASLLDPLTDQKRLDESASVGTDSPSKLSSLGTIDSPSKLSSIGTESPSKVSSIGFDSPGKFYNLGNTTPTKFSRVWVESPSRFSTVETNTPSKLSSIGTDSPGKFSSVEADSSSQFSNLGTESPTKLCRVWSDFPSKFPRVWTDLPSEGLSAGASTSGRFFSVGADPPFKFSSVGPDSANQPMPTDCFPPVLGQASAQPLVTNTPTTLQQPSSAVTQEASSTLQEPDRDVDIQTKNPKKQSGRGYNLRSRKCFNAGLREQSPGPKKSVTTDYGQGDVLAAVSSSKLCTQKQKSIDQQDTDSSSLDFNRQNLEESNPYSPRQTGMEFTKECCPSFHTTQDEFLRSFGLVKRHSVVHVKQEVEPLDLDMECQIVRVECPMPVPARISPNSRLLITSIKRESSDSPNAKKSLNSGSEGDHSEDSDSGSNIVDTTTGRFSMPGSLLRIALSSPLGQRVKKFIKADHIKLPLADLEQYCISIPDDSEQLLRLQQTGKDTYPVKFRRRKAMAIDYSHTYKFNFAKMRYRKPKLRARKQEQPYLFKKCLLHLLRLDEEEIRLKTQRKKTNLNQELEIDSDISIMRMDVPEQLFEQIPKMSEIGLQKIPGSKLMGEEENSSPITGISGIAVRTSATGVRKGLPRHMRPCPKSKRRQQCQEQDQMEEMVVESKLSSSEDDDSAKKLNAKSGESEDVQIVSVTQTLGDSSMPLVIDLSDVEDQASAADSTQATSSTTPVISGHDALKQNKVLSCTCVGAQDQYVVMTTAAAFTVQNVTSVDVTSAATWTFSGTSLPTTSSVPFSSVSAYALQCMPVNTAVSIGGVKNFADQQSVEHVPSCGAKYTHNPCTPDLYNPVQNPYYPAQNPHDPGAQNPHDTGAPDQHYPGIQNSQDPAAQNPAQNPSSPNMQNQHNSGGQNQNEPGLRKPHMPIVQNPQSPQNSGEQNPQSSDAQNPCNSGAPVSDAQNPQTIPANPSPVQDTNAVSVLHNAAEVQSASGSHELTFPTAQGSLAHNVSQSSSSDGLSVAQTQKSHQPIPTRQEVQKHALVPSRQPSLQSWAVIPNVPAVLEGSGSQPWPISVPVMSNLASVQAAPMPIISAQLYNAAPAAALTCATRGQTVVTCGSELTEGQNLPADRCSPSAASPVAVTQSLPSPGGAQSFQTGQNALFGTHTTIAQNVPASSNLSPGVLMPGGPTNSSLQTLTSDTPAPPHTYNYGTGAPTFMANLSPQSMAPNSTNIPSMTIASTQFATQITQSTSAFQMPVFPEATESRNVQNSPHLNTGSVLNAPALQQPTMVHAPLPQSGPIPHPQMTPTSSSMLSSPSTQQMSHFQPSAQGSFVQNNTNMQNMEQTQLQPPMQTAVPQTSFHPQGNFQTTVQQNPQHLRGSMPHGQISIQPPVPQPSMQSNFQTLAPQNSPFGQSNMQAQHSPYMPGNQQTRTPQNSPPFHGNSQTFIPPNSSNMPSSFQANMPSNSPLMQGSVQSHMPHNSAYGQGSFQTFVPPNSVSVQCSVRDLLPQHSAFVQQDSSQTSMPQNSLTVHTSTPQNSFSVPISAQTSMPQNYLSAPIIVQSSVPQTDYSVQSSMPYTPYVPANIQSTAQNPSYVAGNIQTSVAQNSSFVQGRFQTSMAQTSFHGQDSAQTSHQQSVPGTIGNIQACVPQNSPFVSGSIPTPMTQNSPSGQGNIGTSLPQNLPPAHDHGQTFVPHSYLQGSDQTSVPQTSVQGSNQSVPHYQDHVHPSVLQISPQGSSPMSVAENMVFGPGNIQTQHSAVVHGSVPVSLPQNSPCEQGSVQTSGAQNPPQGNAQMPGQHSYPLGQGSGQSSVPQNSPYIQGSATTSMPQTSPFIQGNAQASAAQNSPFVQSSVQTAVPQSSYIQGRGQSPISTCVSQSLPFMQSSLQTAVSQNSAYAQGVGQMPLSQYHTLVRDTIQSSLSQTSPNAQGHIPSGAPQQNTLPLKDMAVVSKSSVTVQGPVQTKLPQNPSCVHPAGSGGPSQSMMQTAFSNAAPQAGSTFLTATPMPGIPSQNTAGSTGNQGVSSFPIPPPVQSSGIPGSCPQSQPSPPLGICGTQVSAGSVHTTNSPAFGAHSSASSQMTNPAAGDVGVQSKGTNTGALPSQTPPVRQAESPSVIIVNDEDNPEELRKKLSVFNLIPNRPRACLPTQQTPDKTAESNSSMASNQNVPATQTAEDSTSQLRISAVYGAAELASMFEVASNSFQVSAQPSQLAKTSKDSYQQTVSMGTSVDNAGPQIQIGAVYGAAELANTQQATSLGLERPRAPFSGVSQGLRAFPARYPAPYTYRGRQPRHEYRMQIPQQNFASSTVQRFSSHQPYMPSPGQQRFAGVNQQQIVYRGRNAPNSGVQYERRQPATLRTPYMVQAEFDDDYDDYDYDDYNYDDDDDDCVEVICVDDD